MLRLVRRRDLLTQVLNTDLNVDAALTHLSRLRLHATWLAQERTARFAVDQTL